MAILSRSELIKWQTDTDLYRSKYKHPDTTMFTWNYSGYQPQGWTNEKLNQGRCYVSGLTLVSPILTGINKSTHKYLTVKLETRIDVVVSLMNSSRAWLANVACTYVPYTNILTCDLSNSAQWANASYVALAPAAEGYIHYIKIDKINLFGTNPDDYADNVDSNLLNPIATTFSNPPQSMGTHNPDSFSQLVTEPGDTVVASKRNTLMDLINNGKGIAFNGCATCDVNQCACNASVYQRSCAAGDVRCPMYNACTCNGTCNGTYAVASCTCDQARYQYADGYTVTETYTYYPHSSYSWRDDYADSYNHWRGIVTQDNGQREYLFHGYYGYGNHKGYMFFNQDQLNDMKAKMNAGRIDNITLRLQRSADAHGYGTCNPITVTMHNYMDDVFWGYTANPSVITAYSYSDTDTKFDRGETKTLTLPTSFAAALRDGAAKGLALYTAGTDKTKYAYFTPSRRNATTVYNSSLADGYDARSRRDSATTNWTKAANAEQDYPNLSAVPMVQITVTRSAAAACGCYMAGYGKVNPSGCTSYGSVPCSACNDACNSYTCTCDQTAYQVTCRDCYNRKYN